MKIFKRFEWLKDDELKIGLIPVEEKLQEIEHIHEFLEFVYVIDGEMVHHINGKEYHCHKGAFLFIKHGEKHAFTAERKTQYINLLVSTEAFSDGKVKCNNLQDIFTLYTLNDFHFEWETLPPFVQFDGLKLMEIENMLHYMLNEYNSRNIGYITTLRNSLFTVLIEFARKMVSEHVSDKAYYGSIKFYDIKQFIDENYQERLTLSDLSQKFFCSTAYLSRLFKKHTGKNFVQYVQCKRIEKAIEYLLTSNKSVEDIAFNVGYLDKNQFFALFKKYTGKTPKKFRDDNKNTKDAYRNLYFN